MFLVSRFPSCFLRLLLFLRLTLATRSINLTRSFLVALQVC